MGLLDKLKGKKKGDSSKAGSFFPAILPYLRLYLVFSFFLLEY